MQIQSPKADILRTLSNRVYPQTIGEMLDWSDWMWCRFGTYTQALKNAVRYFLGDLTISPPDADTSLGSEERRKMMNELLVDYKVFGLLGRVGDEYIQWGNCFTSVDLPRKRMVTCPSCNVQLPAAQISDLKYQQGLFRGTCSNCGKMVTFKTIELTDTTAEMTVNFWNPRLVSINYCPTTHTKVYSIMPSRAWKRAFSEQDPRFVAETPLEMLQAIEMNGVIEMRQEHFKHLATPQPSTLEDELGGWGLPLFMSEFENVILLQMLKRYNEVLLSDYSMPFRLLAPPPTTGGSVSGDTMQTLNLGDFRSNVMGLIDAHRSNPSNIQVSPYPLTYQILGGEAKSLVPMESIEATINQLLNSMCIPLEFKTMSISQTGGPPVGLRRFEKVWGVHVSALDEWLQWFCNCRTDLLRTQRVVCKLVKASIYEDDMSRQYKVQLAMGGAISKGTGFQSIGLDNEVEMTKLQDEMNLQNDLSMKNQQKMDKAAELMAGMSGPQPGTEALMMHQQQQAGAAGVMPAANGQLPPPGAMAPPSGGATAAGGTGTAAGVEELYAQAEQLAEQIRVAPDRQSQLIQLKKTNPPLHAFVKQLIESAEQQAAQQGVVASRQGAPQ